MSLLSTAETFNFIDFFTLGGFQFNVLGDAFKKVEEYVLEKEQFGLDFNDTIPVETAVWDVPFHMECFPPQVYVDFLETFLKLPLFVKYQEVYGEFTFKKLMLHRTPKGYINTWHSHTFDGSVMHALVHITDELRFVEDGGLIEVAEVMDKENVKFDDYAFYHENPTVHIPTKSSIANSGLVTIINNVNPYFRHQVSEVLTDKKRYTLMLALGYKDCIQKREIKHI